MQSSQAPKNRRRVHPSCRRRFPVHIWSVRVLWNLLTSVSRHSCGCNVVWSIMRLRMHWCVCECLCVRARARKWCGVGLLARERDLNLA